jgi:hypothetical protein
MPGIQANQQVQHWDLETFGPIHITWLASSYEGTNRHKGCHHLRLGWWPTLWTDLPYYGQHVQHVVHVEQPVLMEQLVLLEHLVLLEQLVHLDQPL